MSNPNQNKQPQGWNESISTEYRRMANIAIPYRIEQLAMLLTLLPFRHESKFHIVELASGSGELAQALLETFPGATLLALDGSPSMREQTAARLKPFEDRAAVGAFDMAKNDWYGWLDSASVVISSLCVHHLDGAGKQALFKAVHQKLASNGVFLIADLILPPHPEAWRMAEQQWDYRARVQSLEITAGLEAHEHFMASGWNYFREPDAMDQPSTLFNQLTWLRQAGFALVDCFWMYGGFAIFGGYKAIQSDDQTIPLTGITSFEAALATARRILLD